MDLFNWFDLVVGVVLVSGIFVGRKRGMSMELLPVLEALVIVVVGAEIYKIGGEKIADLANGSITLLISYITAYVLFAIIVHMIFSRVKTAVGEKLVGSDMFGSMEYYFGMLAGLIRFAAVLIMFLAVLNARAIDVRREAELQKIQERDLGKTYFPTYGVVQMKVLEQSFTGKFMRKNLEHLLISPTSPTASVAAKRETIGSKRQREFDEVIEPAKKPKS